MLLWYSKNHDTLLKKPCDDAGTKVNITELLLTCQAKRIFLQFKNEIMSKEPETGLEVDQGLTEETFKETLERSRDFSFKKGATRYQVQYLR